MKAKSKATLIDPPVPVHPQNINCWLMRIMRLGGTGSSGYGQHAASVAAAATRRRKSAVEALAAGGGGSAALAASSSAASAFLRPPAAAMSARGRRFSDSLNLMAAAAAQQSRSKSRKGGAWFPKSSNDCEFAVMHFPRALPMRIHSVFAGSMVESNLVRMRNSNLGQSAPSLSASLVRTRKGHQFLITLKSASNDQPWTMVQPTNQPRNR